MDLSDACAMCGVTYDLVAKLKPGNRLVEVSNADVESLTVAMRIINTAAFHGAIGFHDSSRISDLLKRAKEAERG